MNNMKKKLRLFRKWWRKYGLLIVVPLFIISIMSSIINLYDASIIGGILCLSITTIPCGIKAINTNKILWFLRQSFFIFCGLILILIS